jgi:hypothetical protein
LEACLESFPPYADRGVDADQDEEGSAQQLVEYRFSVDVCGDPSFTPSLCDKVKEVLRACEGVLLVGDCAIDIGDYTRRVGSFFRVFLRCAIQRLDWIRMFGVLMEVEVREAMVFGEVVRYGALASTDSCAFSAKQKWTRDKNNLPPHKPINILKIGSLLNYPPTSR